MQKILISNKTLKISLSFKKENRLIWLQNDQDI